MIFRTLGMPGRYCTHGLECNEKDCNTRSIIEKGRFEFFVDTKISKCNKSILICSFKAKNTVFKFDYQNTNMFKSIRRMFDKTVFSQSIIPFNTVQKSNFVLGFKTNLSRKIIQAKYDQLCPNGGKPNQRSKCKIQKHTLI